MDIVSLLQTKKNKNILIKTIILIVTFIGIASPQTVWGSDNSVKELNNRLFRAVFNNNFASVRSSITAGANLEATNDEGLTAAGLAVEKGYFNIAHYILGLVKQKSLVKKDNTIIASGKLNTNKTQMPATMPDSTKIEVPFLKTTELFITPGSQTYKPLPKNAPNPFSPNNYGNKDIPIIGTIQKSSVKPVIQNQTINLKIKTQNPRLAPLRTPDISILRRTQTPTPITPNNKKTQTKVTLKKTNNKVTPLKTPDVPILQGAQTPTPIIPITQETQKKVILKKTNNLKPTKTKADKELEFEEVEFDEEDLFDKVWNKLNKIF